jgi:RNA polymerase sigma-70 factor (ECF subfamily)
MTMFARRSDKEEQAARVARLYRRFGGVIRARCRRILKNPSLADDAVQEVFAAAFTHLDRAADDRAALRWINRACMNHCLNELRAQGRHAEPMAELPERTGDHPEARLIDRDVARRVLADRSPGRRAAALCYLEGLVHREIAVKLGVSRRTVLSRLNDFVERARWITAEVA